ncbi:hypothetical protein DV515_00016594 [Chloebia gouldiae]|uniref:Uncharacterized protein n=1 Tax=Chloebia gouldiae TaxID=44316 RepID=A0A3L8RSC5_CHLGU|nr:hypothetical protein DV515_00016594 [Chloebia gouldiae]
MAQVVQMARVAQMALPARLACLLAQLAMLAALARGAARGGCWSRGGGHRVPRVTQGCHPLVTGDRGVPSVPSGIAGSRGKSRPWSLRDAGTAVGTPRIPFPSRFGAWWHRGGGPSGGGCGLVSLSPHGTAGSWLGTFPMDVGWAPAWATPGPPPGHPRLPPRPTLGGTASPALGTRQALSPGVGGLGAGCPHPTGTEAGVWQCHLCVPRAAGAPRGARQGWHGRAALESPGGAGPGHGRRRVDPVVQHRPPWRCRCPAELRAQPVPAGCPALRPARGHRGAQRRPGAGPGARGQPRWRPPLPAPPAGTGHGLRQLPAAIPVPAG